MLLFGSVIGLLVGLADLHDLVEPQARIVSPLMQQGSPIAAFAAALASACAALLVAARYMRSVRPRLETQPRDAAGSNDAGKAPAANRRRPTALRAGRLSAIELTLRRVSFAFLAIGAAAFTMAEAFEAGIGF